MPEKYQGNWFYPPRTASSIPYKDSPVLRMWKRYADAIAQLKGDGTNTQIKVFPDHDRIELWGRQKLDEQDKASRTGEPRQIKNYTLTDEARREVLAMTPKGSFAIYNVELMHFKTTMVKNVLYFFDVLVWEGMHLLGVEYRERYKIISDRLGKRYLPIGLPKLDGGLFIAENIPMERWDETWKALTPSPYIEGLILKRMGSNSRLQYGNDQNNNGGFLCRVRKPKKNFLH